jgi:hypothetical protein
LLLLFSRNNKTETRKKNGAPNRQPDQSNFSFRTTH